MPFEVADVWIQFEPRGPIKRWIAHKKIVVTGRDKYKVYGKILHTGIPVEKDHHRWIYRPWRNKP